MSDVVRVLVVLVCMAINSWCWYDMGRSAGRRDALRILAQCLEHHIRQLEDEHEG